MGTYPKSVDFSRPVSTSHNFIVPSRAPEINIAFFCLSPPSFSFSFSSPSTKSVCKNDLGSTCSVLGRSLKLSGSYPGGAEAMCGEIGPECNDGIDAGGDREASWKADTPVPVEVELTGLKVREARYCALRISSSLISTMRILIDWTWAL